MIIKLASPIHIKKSHEGSLHEALGIPEGEPIPTSVLEQHKNGPLAKKVNFALNARKWKHK